MEITVDAPVTILKGGISMEIKKTKKKDISICKHQEK